MTATTATARTAPAADAEFDAQACIIGAGPAGLAAGRALAERGFTFDWFEKGSMVGGLWRIDNDNGQVAAYRTLHLNSSRTRTQFPDQPMPATWPDYPSHTLVAQYFQSYAERHDLLRRVTFGSEVTHVAPLPGLGHPGAHGWAVTTPTTGTRYYRDVLVANGHHSTPRRPDFPGRFDGATLHAHDYRDPQVFADRDVVVVGVGNSGMDLACDATTLARSVNLVTRHGVHVLPKYAFGRPIDLLSGPVTAYLPFEVERLAYEAIVRVVSGRPEDRGMPRPDHRMLGAHPTVSAELLDRVGHGDVAMRPAISSLEGDRITFVDGTSVPADLLVLATGYEVSLPFLDAAVYDPAGNAMPLFQRVVHPQRPHLWFIGFIQAVGSGIPLAWHQAQWVGDLVAGTAALPHEAEMTTWIERDQAMLRHRYVASERHTMQVDYWRYIRAMKELRARRAAPSLRERITAPLAGLR